jgi:hypothetical protein
MGCLSDKDTCVPDVEDEEKRHPHFYCIAEELLPLSPGFRILSLHLCDRKKPGSFHGTLVLEKF